MATSSSLLVAKNHFVNQLVAQPRIWMHVLWILSPYHGHLRRDPIQATHLIELPGIDCPAHRDLQALARMSEAGVELGTEIEPEADSPPVPSLRLNEVLTVFPGDSRPSGGDASGP